jgi:hypothetical protein
VAADFIPLADYLRPRPVRENPSTDRDNVIPLPVRRASDDDRAELVAAEAAQPFAPVPECGAGAASYDADASASETITSPELVEILREARVFRARLADAFDDTAARLVRELAAQVLVRELRLAPCEIAELVARVRERIPVVRVRVSSRDAARLHGASNGSVGMDRLSVVADEQLGDGDAIVEVAGGALDARLGVRLAAVLEAFA